MAHRILVYGVTGSGKTTLAAQIAERAVAMALNGRPHLGARVPLDEQRRRIEAICSGDQWILDTAYGDWMDLLMARVDLIVALDYPRWLSLARLLRRSARRVVFRELACNGNIETVGKLFGSDSMVRWHFRSFAGNAPAFKSGWKMTPVHRCCGFGPRRTEVADNASSCWNEHRSKAYL